MEVDMKGRLDMRRVIVEVESVDQPSDGLREHGFLDKVFEFHSEDVQEYLDDLLFTPDALLMGQQTFHGFADLWPTQQGPAADRINSMPKYVASRTLKSRSLGTQRSSRETLLKRSGRSSKNRARACCSTAWEG